MEYTQPINHMSNVPHLYAHTPIHTAKSAPQGQAAKGWKGAQYPKALTRATGWWKDVESKIFVRDFVFYHTHRGSHQKWKIGP